MTPKYTGPVEALAAYDAALVAVIGEDHKGAANPYSSLNGNMFSFLGKEGELALRLGEAEREEFMAAYDAQLAMNHNTVMKEYVAVPDDMLRSQAEETARWLQRSYDYAKTLKPKPTKRKKAAR